MKYFDLDFLAIGDITIDAFIKLKEAEVHCNLNREDCTLSMRFADKIPYEDVFVVPAVGNSPNASVSAHKLGLSSALISNVGKDRNGGDCVRALKKHGVETKYVSSHRGLETNYHYVLWYQTERTILVKHHDFPYKLPRFKRPRLVYLSSLGEKSSEYHKEITHYLKENPEIILAFQPGTYQIKAGIEKMSPIYERSDLFFCNREEAMRIVRTQDTDITKLLDKISWLGPKRIFITDGPNGAYARDTDGAIYFVPIYPDPKPVLERTGAGDAFSSTVSSAILLGLTTQEALMWGPVNSMSVVQNVGAQAGLLSRKELERLIDERPTTYKVTQLR